MQANISETVSLGGFRHVYLCHNTPLGYSITLRLSVVTHYGMIEDYMDIVLKDLVSDLKELETVPATWMDFSNWLLARDIKSSHYASWGCRTASKLLTRGLLGIKADQTNSTFNMSEEKVQSIFYGEARLSRSELATAPSFIERFFLPDKSPYVTTVLMYQLDSKDMTLWEVENEIFTFTNHSALALDWIRWRT